MKFTTNEFTEVYETPATTDNWKWGGFTPKYYVWLWIEAIDSIMKNAKPFPVDLFDNYESTEEQKEITEDKKVSKTESQLIEEEVKNFNPEDYYEYE